MILSDNYSNFTKTKIFQQYIIISLQASSRSVALSFQPGAGEHGLSYLLQVHSPTEEEVCLRASLNKTQHNIIHIQVSSG